MFSRLTIGLIEFTATVFLCGLVILLTYFVFINANPDFDMEAEIKKGNISVGLLVATILFSASMILQKGMSPVISLFRLYALAPEEVGISPTRLFFIGLGHLTISMISALLTISVVLRLFGRFRKKIGVGKELEQGNVAIGLILSSVVLTAAFYLSDGTRALSQALIPQPPLAQIQVLK